MMHYLKFMDVFTVKFHLYTNNQPRFRNAFGGIMTFIFILLCIGILIGNSYDDLKRLNPISSKSEIVDSEPKIVNFNDEKIWIPFRMVTYEGKFVDHRGMLYILPYFVEGKYKDGLGMDLQYHLLKYKLCNETSLVNRSNNYKINVKLNEVFCIDKDDILFGGSWNGNFINYLEINLHLCENGIEFNASNPRCSKMEDLLKDKRTSYIFEIFYPVVQFQPTNLETPLAVIYRSYYYRLNNYNYKVQRLYLQENILSDDRSILFSNYKNSSYWGSSFLYGDNYILPYENNNYNSSRIYSLDIYMDDGCIYYTRTYKKLFLILSNIFPLFRIALFFLNKFTQHIKMTFVKRNLAGLIFENKSKSRSSIIKLNNFQKNIIESRNKIILSNNEDNPKEILKFNQINNYYIDNKYLNKINIYDKNFELKNNINEKKDNEKIIINNSINKSNISLKNDNAIKILNKKDILLVNSKNKTIAFPGPLISPNSPKKKKKFSKYKSNLFSYYDFYCDYIYRIVNPRKFCSFSETYFIVSNYMCQLYDISNYIILVKQFILMNKALIDIYKENEIYPSKPFKKININDSELINRLNMELKKEKSIIFANYI